MNEFIGDSIKYLRSESNFFIRPARDFKSFRGHKPLRETYAAYAMILSNDAKFLINYLYVVGTELSH